MQDNLHARALQARKVAENAHILRIKIALETAADRGDFVAGYVFDRFNHGEIRDILEGWFEKEPHWRVQYAINHNTAMFDFTHNLQEKLGVVQAESQMA